MLAVWLTILAADMLLMSLLTLALYAWDKRQAGRRGWRIPERRLHLLALLGGWPGGLVGQRWLRHKSVKKRFRLWFTLTVIAHILVAGALTYLFWSLDAR